MIQLYKSNSAKKFNYGKFKKIAQTFNVNVNYFNDNLSISQTNLKVENSTQSLNMMIKKAIRLWVFLKVFHMSTLDYIHS